MAKMSKIEEQTAQHLRNLIEKIRVHIQHPESTRDKVSLVTAASEAEKFLNRLPTE